jgi:hypothetical protein
MSNLSEKMTALLKQLEANEITAERFRELSGELIGEVGKGGAVSLKDPVRRERIDTAAEMLRKL